MCALTVMTPLPVATRGTPNMTWITRIALMSACFYVVLAFLVDFGLLVVARYKGTASLWARHQLWFVFFGSMWAISFWLAYRISFPRR